MTTTELKTSVSLDQAILFIDLVGFTPSCAHMCVDEVGLWVSTFYSATNLAGEQHRVRILERRGDCCICLTDDSDGECMMTRMLAFCCDVQGRLDSLPERFSKVRMGLALGDVVILEADGSDGMPGFCCVQGDSVNTAARMEELSSPGVVLVHKGALDRWVKETGFVCPILSYVNCKGKGVQASASYDCHIGAFSVASRDDYFTAKWRDIAAQCDNTTDQNVKRRLARAHSWCNFDDNARREIAEAAARQGVC